MEVGKASAEDGDDVMDNRARGRGHDTNPLWQQR